MNQLNKELEELQQGCGNRRKDLFMSEEEAEMTYLACGERSYICLECQAKIETKKHDIKVFEDFVRELKDEMQHEIITHGWNAKVNLIINKLKGEEQ